MENELINSFNNLSIVKKHELGQFMTTKCDYILQGMTIPKDVKIIEPFAGKGHLVEWAQLEIEQYDIESTKPNIIARDTLLNPPDYSGKFILTNPPYLAKNKTSNNEIFNKYGVDDLYKCFIKEICSCMPIGGIIIIPLNFWCSIRKSDIELRALFLMKYNVKLINVFEEDVFDDTSTTVCSIQFELGTSAPIINMVIYPKKTLLEAKFDKINYLIGGHIYNLKTSGKYKITRLTSKNLSKNNTKIIAKCIDDNAQNKIKLYLSDEPYVDNTTNFSCRTYASLVIEPAINEKRQEYVVCYFNAVLEEWRRNYNSLFLTNYRESNGIARKRISFELVYLLIEFILDFGDNHQL